MISSILSDLYRYSGSTSLSCFLKNFYSNRGFRFMFYFRLGKAINKYTILAVPYKIFYRHIQNKFTIHMPLSVICGDGIYISHPFSISINRSVVIGDNINISQGVTIGIKQKGKNMGVPKLQSNIYLGPNSVIIGDVFIQNDVAVGANSVVTKSIPEMSVVAGVPGKIIGYTGSKDLINNKVWPLSD